MARAQPGTCCLLVQNTLLADAFRSAEVVLLCFANCFNEQESLQCVMLTDCYNGVRMSSYGAEGIFIMKRSNNADFLLLICKMIELGNMISKVPPSFPTYYTSIILSSI